MFWWINWMGWPCVNISTCMGASGLKSHIFSSCKHTSKASWDVNVKFLSSSHKANVNARSKCLQKCIVLCFPGFRTFQVGAKRVQVWVQCFHLELTDDCVSLFGLDFDIQCACTLVWARCGRTVSVPFAAFDGVWYLLEDWARRIRFKVSLGTQRDPDSKEKEECDLMTNHRAKQQSRQIKGRQ